MAYLILLAFLLTMVVLVFGTALKVVFIFNTQRENISLTLFWLYPFLRSHITKEGGDVALTVYIFGKRMLRKVLRSSAGSRNNLKLVKAVKPYNINVDTCYGFRDPFITGVACGAVNAASQLINIDSIRQQPDFITENDYVYLSATADINIGSTIINWLRA